MKRILFILLCTIYVLAAHAQDRYMRVTQLDGTITTFAVNTIDSIDFVTESNTKTIIGKLHLMTNPNWKRGSDVPVLTLALYTPDTTYYIANPYTEEYVNDWRKITTCGKQFDEGEYVLVTGELTTHLDTYDTEYYRINISSIESHFVDIAGDGSPTHYTSYVYSYHFPAEMYLIAGRFCYGSYPCDSTIDSPYGFDVRFKDDDKQMVGQWQQGTEREIFDSLSLKHGDIDFHQDIIVSSACPLRPHAYLGIDFASIMVTSDVDFDEEHPAGTTLNDIVQFIAYTPYPFIKSGYKYSNPRGNDSENLKDELMLIDKPLSECTAEDFILTFGIMNDWFCGDVFPACYLYIKATPTLSKQHTITVTIVDDAGKRWQNSINLNWNQ